VYKTILHLITKRTHLTTQYIYRTVLYASAKLKSMKESLKCHVCLQFLTAPILMCKAGHCICCICYEGVKKSNRQPKCAVCRSAAGYVARNRCLEEILEAFSLECSYGCGEIIEAGNYRRHQDACCSARWEF